MKDSIAALRLLALTFAILATQSFATPVFSQDDAASTEQPAAEEQPAEDGGSQDGIPTSDEAISEGGQLFRNNCSQCHAVHEQVVGPALANVWERQPVPWLINFIKYPQRVIDGGDPYAVELYEKYRQYMPNHDFLSDDDILNILAWVKAETAKGPETAAAPGGGTGEEGAEVTASSAVNPNLLLAVIVGLIVLLVIVLATMLLLISVLSKYIKQEKELTEEDQEFLGQKFDINKIIKNPVVIGVASLIFLNIVAKATIDGIYSIGVQQGYAPEQPIKFSHKLHAGYYEIDCKYCHTGVEKSKSANIPSANICMNCHGEIRTTSPEIQKIYAAIENDEPIQWVRIHNLPDLSYFNHSQHVKVAGLECQTCHGEIQEMEVVQQHSLLTMGWCINCHREQEINFKDNPYYEDFVKVHQANSKEPITVEDIGGLECSKCHY